MRTHQIGQFIAITAFTVTTGFLCWLVERTMCDVIATPCLLSYSTAIFAFLLSYVVIVAFLMYSTDMLLRKQLLYRAARRECLDCGYPRIGNNGKRCSECGSFFAVMKTRTKTAYHEEIRKIPKEKKT
jgi:hypothetical protein